MATGPLVIPYAEMLIDGPEIGTLIVVVDRAKNLPNRRTMGKQDPYCAMRLGKEAKKTTADRRGGQTPRWDQELRFTVRDSPDHYRLKCSVFNDDKKTDLIGEAWIDLKALIVRGGGQNDLWHQLNFKGKYAGNIRIEMTYYDTRENAVAEAAKERKRAKDSPEVDNSYNPQPREWSSPQTHDVFAIDVNHHAAGYNPYEPQEDALPSQEYYDDNSVYGQFPTDEYNLCPQGYPSDPRPILPHSYTEPQLGWHQHSSPTLPLHQMASSPHSSPHSSPQAHQSPPALPDVPPRQSQMSASPTKYTPYRDSPLRQSITSHEVLPRPSHYDDLSGDQDASAPLPPTHRNPMSLPSPSAQNVPPQSQQMRQLPQPQTTVEDWSPLQMIEHRCQTQTQRALPTPPDRKPNVVGSHDDEIVAGEFPAPHQLTQNFGVDFVAEPVEQDNRGRYIRRNSGLDDGPYRLPQRAHTFDVADVFDERNTYRSQPQVVKPRAVSPNAAHFVPRKSISPHPQVQAERSGMGTVPFSPDSYDALLPDSGGPTRNLNSKDEREIARQNEVDKLRDQGPIIGNDGRVIDPSDHLPSDTWAPEPERKQRQPEHVIRIRTRDEARYSQPGSSPLSVMSTSSTDSPHQPKHPTHQSPLQSPHPAPNSLYQIPSSQTPPDSTGHRRNRLQKPMPVRAPPTQPIPHVHSSPASHPPARDLTHEMRNSAPPTPISGHGHGQSMYSTPPSGPLPNLQRPALSKRQLAPINYHSPRGSYHPSNAPTPTKMFEMRLQSYVPPQDGYTDPLAAEMSMIDIGPSRGGKAWLRSKRASSGH
ncbi:hypothetical protein DV736_g2120, partial [Chaetothyriales sp. CBS 134916]